MLLGQYHAKLEAKNRIAFPAKLREETGGKLIITYGFENSLLITTHKDWEDLIQINKKDSFLLQEVRDTQLFVYGGASEVILDTQGRFVLPNYLKEFARIEKKVVFVGVGRYIRVWSENIWDDYQKLMSLRIHDTAQKLGEKMSRRLGGEKE